MPESYYRELTKNMPSAKASSIRLEDSQDKRHLKVSDRRPTQGMQNTSQRGCRQCIHAQSAGSDLMQWRRRVNEHGACLHLKVFMRALKAVKSAVVSSRSRSAR